MLREIENWRVVGRPARASSAKVSSVNARPAYNPSINSCANDYGRCERLSPHALFSLLISLRQFFQVVVAPIYPSQCQLYFSEFPMWDKILALFSSPVFKKRRIMYTTNKFDLFG